VRDASFTLEALWVAACPDEAHQFFDYLAASSAGQVRGGHNLQIMFGIGGEHDLTERELGYLSGWRDSRPVRVGNGAWKQRQIDVYGELIGSAHRLVEQLNPDHPGAGPWREFLIACADTAARRWGEPDQGIWETRGEPRHFLYSKLMCWVALDRAIAMADTLRAHDRAPRWRTAAGEIRDEILTHGWSDSTKSFTQSFGSTDLDASNLMLVCVGFLPPDDPRMRATVMAIADELTVDGLVLRYEVKETDDALSGEEGSFTICSFWLVSALVEIGELSRARDLCEKLLSYASPLQLYAEEIDPRSGRHLGNFPQAFTHLALINAVMHVIRAEQGVAGGVLPFAGEPAQRSAAW
jgi:GH15 family glucan-1,4-alpha-glucosidase